MGTRCLLSVRFEQLGGTLVKLRLDTSRLCYSLHTSGSFRTRYSPLRVSLD